MTRVIGMDTTQWLHSSTVQGIFFTAALRFSTMARPSAATPNIRADIATYSLCDAWVGSPGQGQNESNKPGPAQVGAISKAQKIAKGIPSVILQYSKIEKAKNGASGAPGPASAASPWPAKRGTLPKLSTFMSQLKGGPFGEKQSFEKSLNAEKLKGGPFGIFKHPICCKISKKLRN